MIVDHRGRHLLSIPERTESEEIRYEEATRNRDFVECVFRSFSGTASEETFHYRDLLDFGKDSNEVYSRPSNPETPRRSYDVLYFSPGEQKSANDESEFHYVLSPTNEGFRFFNEYEETKIDNEQISRSLHLAQSITMAVDETTRHCRSIYSALLGNDEDVDEVEDVVEDENDGEKKNSALKEKLRKSCSKQMESITNASRRLLSCPVGKRDDTPPSKKMWKACKESTFALQNRCRKLERAISETASKTRQKVDRRRKGERNFNGFKIPPNSFESRQAGAQRLRELIQQKHYLNVSDRNCFNQERLDKANKSNEATETTEASRDPNAFEATWSPQEALTLEWEKMQHDLSTTTEQTDTKISIITAEAGTSSPENSKSTSSIEKLSELLDQYFHQTTSESTPPPTEKKTHFKSTSVGSMDMLGAILGEYFNPQTTKTVPRKQKKTECKVIIEDESFHTQVKKATESLSYSSGLTECSSEDSSIDCSAIVFHENNVTEQFGAYQADFDLYRELEASMMKMPPV